METERHTLRAMTATGLLGEFMELIYDIRWVFIIISVLIIADLYYGVSESHKKFARTKDEKYKVRFSRASRRTLNKSVDYLCYVLISGILAKAEAEPYGVHAVVVVSIACLFIICFELSSIIGHICYLHDMPFRFNVRYFLVAFIKKKDKQLGEAANEAMEPINKDEI